MRSEPSPGPAAFFRGPGPVLLLAGSLGVCAYFWAAVDRSNVAEHPPLLLGLLLALALPLLFPMAGALGIFFIVPFFGNFAGGRYMEILNIPLAAGVLGLVLRARRRGLPPPRGALWSASLVVLFTATLALIPTFPGVGLRLAQINSLPEAVVETLTARETDPLYSLSSFAMLVLAVGWAYAVVWADFGKSFARKALWSVAASFLLVMALGALDLHNRIDLQALYLRPIDPRSLAYEGFQSIFWNPSWFAFYFVMAFGLVAGLLWTETLAARIFLAAALAASYLYSFANPQRGAFLALHALLLAALLAVSLGSRWRPQNLWRPVVLLLAFAVLATVALRVVPSPEWRGRAWSRLMSPLETDTVRKNLINTAGGMWHDSPLFGIGEGAFGWRYGEYARLGADPSTDAASGDAHSTYLQILATRGVFGLAAYLALLVVLGRQVLLAARRTTPERGIALGLGFSLVAFLTYSFVQNLLYLQATQILFWGIVALAAILAPKREASRALNPARRRWVLAVAGVAALGLQLVWSWPKLAQGAERIAREPRGFYGVEKWGGTAMRWSSRRGTLCLYPTGPVVNLPVLAAPLDLWAEPVTVSLSQGKRRLGHFQIRRPTIREFSFHLPEGVSLTPRAKNVPFGKCVAELHPFRLTVETSRVWSPFSVDLSGDTRHLGVAVFEPSFSAPTRPQGQARE